MLQDDVRILAQAIRYLSYQHERIAQLDVDSTCAAE